MNQPKVYLAGPDVFHPDAVGIGARKKELCAQSGLLGLFPFDNEISGNSSDISSAIYEANVKMMREADCGIFNLTPFRGPSADVGTVYELGMMAALGKEVFAYSNEGGTLIEKLKRGTLTFDPATGVWRDENGMSVEDFGNSDNLMIDASFRVKGRRIHRGEVAIEDRFTDLNGFLVCLSEAQKHYKVSRASRAA